MTDATVHKTHNPGFLQISEAARKEIIEIDRSKFLDLWPKLKEQGGLLIDVREDHEWTEGHLVDAVHLGRGILERDIETLAPSPNTPLVLYCGGGYRSALAALSLKTMGFRQVLSLAGGYRHWLESGLPIKR